MSVAIDHSHGPYTVDDLDAMPDEGKGFELAHGWLIPLSPSLRHDMAAETLKTLLSAAESECADPVTVMAPVDISTPAGVRRPDVAVIDRNAARSAHHTHARTIHGADLLLVVEVVSRRSASERVDRIDKPVDYAAAGIPNLWIIDLEPEPVVQVMKLEASTYRHVATFRAGLAVDVNEPFPIKFDPARLLDLP